jgi:leucyl/phenylalanyl-tRNA--protein transferase
MRSSRVQVIPPEVLLQAYAQGYFPMADSERGRIQWYTADPRAILPLNPFHVPRRLQRALKTAEFTYSTDQHFEEVVRHCADRPSTWINEGIVRSYLGIHQAGHAHSVEVRLGEELVGGLYGVHLGGAFFGESMFHRAPNAAKAALVHLAARLQSRGFRMLEIQMITPLTEQFGARHINRSDYPALLADAISTECTW